MDSRTANVVVIGGGCIGTSTAYHLAKAGVDGVVLLERDYLCSGSTGRCGGGMRQQWSMRGNVILAKHALEAFRNFQDELGCNIDFVQGGYLLTAYTQEMLDEFRSHVAIQNSLDVPTRIVDPHEVSRIAPLLNLDGLVGAAYGPTDGLANPFLVVDGYARKARELGATIHTRTEVTGLLASGSRIHTVQTNQGEFKANWVINATGGWTARIAAMVGAQVPISPYRHQIFVTEPIERCHEPMVIDLHHNIYFSQARHGAFLTGQTDAGEPSSFLVSEKWRSAAEIAAKLVRLMPRLKDLNIVRQWAGLYEVTPDRQPIIGRCPPFENLLIGAGFSGHGFMLSPITGKLLSEIVVHGRALTVDVADYSIERFDSKQYTIEANVV